MGRKRIDESEKKIKKSVGIKQKYLDLIQQENINLSELINKLLMQYFKK